MAYIVALQYYINDTKPDFAGPDMPQEVTHANTQSKKTLLTEEKEESIEEEYSEKEDQGFYREETVATSPYEKAYQNPDPRALINALTKLGEQQ